MARVKKLGFLVACCAFPLFALGACSTLPDSGPSTSDVLQKASATDAMQYELIDIDPEVVSALHGRQFDSFSSRFRGSRIAKEPVIGVGDAVVVTIWEASLGRTVLILSSPDRSAAGRTAHRSRADRRPGREALPSPTPGGSPGRRQTTRAVQKTIEKALQGKAIQPQVLVTVTRAVSNAVSVGGEVANGARVSLSVEGGPACSMS